MLATDLTSCYFQELHYLGNRLSSGQPAYLHSLLTPARKARQLQSSTSHLLFIPRIKTNIGSRAFSVAAPTLWNSLPVSVKSGEDISTFTFYPQN